MSSDRGAGGEMALAGTADNANTPILPGTEHARKQAPLGYCVCGTPIGSNVRSLGCPTCAAWRRWFGARRIVAEGGEDA